MSAVYGLLCCTHPVRKVQQECNGGLCPELLVKDDAVRDLRLDINGPENPVNTLRERLSHIVDGKTK